MYNIKEVICLNYTLINDRIHLIGGTADATNSAEINVEEPVKMTEAEWEAKKRLGYMEKLPAWKQIMGNDGNINCTVVKSDLTNTISKGEIK